MEGDPDTRQRPAASGQLEAVVSGEPGAWQSAITATVPKILSLTLVALGFIAFKSHSLSTRLGLEARRLWLSHRIGAARPLSPMLRIGADARCLRRWVKTYVNVQRVCISLVFGRHGWG